MSAKSHSLEFSLFGGAPRIFQDKEPGFFLFLLRFMRFFVQRIFLISTANKNVVAVRAYGEMLYGKVKEIIHVRI